MRAAGGPAEQTFASLVGLELRPRRLRDAAALWGALRSAKGHEARDAVWAHPDLLPTSADLDDPLGFAAHAGTEESAATDAEFDAALAALLSSEEADQPSDEGGEPDAGEAGGGQPDGGQPPR